LYVALLGFLLLTIRGGGQVLGRALSIEHSRSKAGAEEAWRIEGVSTSCSVCWEGKSFPLLHTSFYCT